MGGDSGGTDIVSLTVNMLAQTGPYGDDFIVVMDGNRDFPFTLTQGQLQFLNHPDISEQIGQPPFELQCFLQSSQITGRIVHIGFLDFHIIQSHDRVQFDVLHLGTLAYNLAVDLGILRHIDNDITQNLGLTTEPATFFQAVQPIVFLLGSAERGQMLRAGTGTAIRGALSL